MSYDIDSAIRRIPHHPKPGILFYDLMPLFESPEGLAACVDGIAAWARPREVDVVLGAEARGFILGGAIAREIGAGLACARKPGKLPYEVVRREYDLEYGTDVLEIHRDAIRPGRRVLVHDDLLATGGTAAAKCQLVEELGGVVAGIAVVVELTFLSGRARLAGHDVMSLVAYDTEDVGE
ncbi:MAG: adenine phosphoribosyltransferase [Miltoncostaeaceae bacterium]